MKHKILSAVFGMLILSTPALAVMGAGDGEIGVGYGSTDIDSSIGIDSAAHYTLRGGYLFNDQLEIEGQFASANEDTFNDSSTHTNATVGFSWRLGN